MQYGQAEVASGARPTTGVPEAAQVDPDSGTSGETYTLTSDTDSITGTDNNDVFTGVINVATPANGTIQVGDAVDGGAGTDTFVMRVANGDPSSATVPELTNIETLQLRALVDTTVDLQGIAPDLTSIVVDNPLNDVQVDNAPASVASYTVQDVAQDAVDVAINTAAGLTSGSDDALAITLSGASAADTSTGTNFVDLAFTGAGAGDGFDKVTINSAGSANRLNSLLVQDNAASTMDSLTITGSQDLRINMALDFSDTSGTIDASAATGNVSLLVGTEDITATFGSGDDRLAMGTAGDLTAADTIDMGEGTDTFAWAETATSTVLNAALGRVSNFEKLEFTAGTTAIDMDLVGGVNTVVQSGAADAGGLTISDMQDDDYVEISGDNAGDVTFTAKLDDGSNVLNLTLDTVTSGGNLVATNMDTVNLTIAGSDASSNNGHNFEVATNATINVTGSQDVDLGTLVGTNASVDASAFTGDLTVVGEAGNNTLTGGSGDDDLEGGAGQDTIILTAGGTDNVVLDVTAAADRDTITGFTAGIGGDTIDLDDNGTDDVAAADVETFTGAQASVTLDTADENVHVFNFEASNNSADLSAATDGSELLKAVATEGTSLSALTVVADATGHIVAYDGGNAYLYYFAEGDTDVGLEADEIVLIGTFEDVEVGALTHANFV